MCVCFFQPTGFHIFLKSFQVTSRDSYFNDITQRELAILVRPGTRGGIRKNEKKKIHYWYYRI